MTRTGGATAVALGACALFACDSNRVSNAVPSAASLVVTTALAQEPGQAKGCSLQGSWYGFDPVPTVPAWMTTVSGQSASSGSIILELFAFDGTLAGTFPTVVKTTLLRGIWERIDGNRFKVTALGASIDGNGHAVTLGRFDAIDSLSDDCNTVTVGSGVLHVFLANQNPISDTPLFSIPMADHHGYRIRFQ